MDIVLQAAIGLLVAVAVVWVLIVKRKAKGIGTLVYGGVLSAVCVTALVFGLIRQFSGGSDTETLDKEDMLAFGSTLAKYGAYEQAEDIIDDYSRLYGYDDDCSLLMARIYALQGAYDKAENIYNRFAEDDDYAEVIKAERQALSQLYDTDGTEQEASSGDNVASEDESADDQSSNAVTQAVVAAIDKLSKGTDFDTYAKLVIDSVKAFEQYSGTSIDSLSEEEQAAIKALRSSIVKMRNECNGAFNTAAVREAFLRLNLFAKDYKAIAEVIDDKATYDELVIASELYLNGVITGADFSSDYAQEYKDNALEVGQHLSDSYADIKEDVSSTEAAELKSTLESWNAQIMHPQLTEMKNTMTSLVDNDETGNDSSKVNLQIAKVEHYLEDEVKRDEHIYDAIIESVDSDDEEYSQPMGQILQIINNTGSSEGITEVPGYVAKALQNALPTDMESYVPEGTIDNTTNQSGGTGTDIESVKEFSQAVSECVSKIKSTISIGKINTDDFEEISASVIISSDYANSSEELKNIISVYDCGIEIKDFTIEKVNYSSVKTILICDVSGSMSGSISDLRNAVSTYVNSRNSKESISIVTFNDGVTGRVDFGASDQQLLEFAAGMGAGGGTAIYNTLYSTLENFNTSANCNNVIIVMTDGCDGSARNSETIKNELGALVDAKGVTVYTLGLGSVDTAYLNAIADAGNGSFVYASDSVSLGAFYDLLQGQVDNQYIIKYKAVDTMTQTGRTLEVKIDSENLSDLKYYSLTGDDSEGGDGSNTVDGLQPDQISVNGLSVRKAYRGSDDIENTLIGSGFSKDSTATLKLNGNIDYDISLTYVDENTYSLKIPSSVAVGT